MGISVAFYGGQLTEGVFTDLLIKPWDTEFKDTKLLALSAAYRLYRFPFGLSFEVEAGVGRRFDDEEMWEFWTALGARWDNFPWNEYVYTTAGITFFGPNYSTKISPHERDRNDGDETHWMNFFAPEITLAHPDLPEAALLLRLHHRSGMGGLYNGTTSGSTFLSAGTRLFF